MIKIQQIALYRFDMRTRFPFRYGIAEMRELPHVFVRITALINGVKAVGTSADHLPPRWFKKDPNQHPSDEIEEMLRVIEWAAENASGVQADSAFAWWRSAYSSQLQWAEQIGIPPLLAHFGVSLIERALIDASARAANQNFQAHLLSGGLGFDPSAIHRELQGFDWQPVLGMPALNEISLRHTVGLGDPIDSGSIPDEDRVDDGLPQSLQDSINHYGLTHFKVKLCGDLNEDLERLKLLNECFEEHCPDGFQLSLDGNEQYSGVADFAEAWAKLYEAVPMLRNNLLFIEQPISRDRALEVETGAIGSLLGQPAVIIDESDAEIDSLPRALSVGYAGTSHKNCKGVFKGLGNRCLLAKRKQESAAQDFIMSGEDLANVGPQALLQDLAVQSVLGISNVERNGHHYFRGLSAFPDGLNQQVLEAHPDLYESHPDGFASLRVKRGKLNLTSVNRAAFGAGAAWDLSFAVQYKQF